MLTGHLLMAFLAASVLLSITPGPGVLFIITRTLSQGRSAGLASVAGVALGNFGNALGASIGLAAIFAISAAAFTVVKLTGAAYLIYLGLKALRQPTPQQEALDAVTLNVPQIFIEGFWVALLNPKTAIFFGAFLPQFIDASQPTLPQTVMLGALFVMIAASADSAYVLVAAKAAPIIRGFTQGSAMGRYLTGGIFIGLGLLTAFTAQRHTKA